MPPWPLWAGCVSPMALAATGRSFVQIVQSFDEAPLAYTLSAISAVVYIVATLALVFAGSRGWYLVAWIAIVFELAGVLIVGALSFLLPELFAHPTVWSWFGLGYLFVPLVLIGLAAPWLGPLAALPALAGVLAHEHAYVQAAQAVPLA